MAEGGEPPIQNVYNKSTIRSKERKTIVHGDKVETEQDTGAEEIGAVAASGSSRLGPNQEKGGFYRVVEQVRAENQIRSAERRRTDELQKTPEQISKEKYFDGLINRAQKLIDKEDYKGAIYLLKYARVSECDLYTPKLMLLECHVCLDKNRSDYWVITLIERLAKTMTSSEPKFDDLMDSANDFIVSKYYTRAVILLRILSDIYVAKASRPDRAVNGIQSCSEKMYSATKQLIEQGGRFRLIGINYGIEFMKEILRDLRSVKYARPGNQSLKEASCREYIGASLQLIEKYEKSIKYLKLGVEILDERLISTASKYRVYGSLLYQLGVAYDKLGKFDSDAENYYVKSIKAKRDATDYDDDVEKTKDILLSAKKLGLGLDF